MIHGFNRPRSICMSRQNRALTLNKCDTVSWEEKRDLFVLIKGLQFPIKSHIFPVDLFVFRRDGCFCLIPTSSI